LNLQTKELEMVKKPLWFASLKKLLCFLNKYFISFYFPGSFL